MWRSGTLRPDILRELHIQVTQNLHVSTELFHEVDIDGESIFRRMPRRAKVVSDSSSYSSEEMEVVSDELHSHT